MFDTFIINVPSRFVGLDLTYNIWCGEFQKINHIDWLSTQIYKDAGVVACDVFEIRSLIKYFVVTVYKGFNLI